MPVQLLPRPNDNRVIGMIPLCLLLKGMPDYRYEGLWKEDHVFCLGGRAVLNTNEN